MIALAQKFIEDAQAEAESKAREFTAAAQERAREIVNEARSRAEDEVNRLNGLKQRLERGRRHLGSSTEGRALAHRPGASRVHPLGGALAPK